MKSCLVVLVSTIVTASLAGQSGLQAVGIWPDVAGFSTRGHLPAGSEGSLRIGMARDWFRLGPSADDDEFGTVHGMRAVVQNQRGDRPLPVTLMILRGAPVGGPEGNEILLSTGPIDLPLGTARAEAFDLRVALGTPARVVPTRLSWSLAIRLPAAVDGAIVSVHAAAANVGPVGESVRPNAPVVMRVADLTRNVTIDTPQRTAALFALTTDPVLDVGADVPLAQRRGPNPTFGMTGRFPSRARGDGVAFRIRHADSPDGLVFVLGTPLGFLDGAWRLGGLHGGLLVQPPLMPSAVFDGRLDTGGELGGVSVLAPAPFHLPVGRLQFQAIVLSQSGAGILSNGVAFDER